MTFISCDFALSFPDCYTVSHSFAVGSARVLQRMTKGRGKRAKLLRVTRPRSTQQWNDQRIKEGVDDRPTTSRARKIIPDNHDPTTVRSDQCIGGYDGQMITPSLTVKNLVRFSIKSPIGRIKIMIYRELQCSPTGSWRGPSNL